MNDQDGSQRWPIILGGLLVVAGVVLLVAQQAGFDISVELGRLGWPIFIIVPGVVLLAVGLILDAPVGVGLSTAGAIVSMVGLVLAYQSATGHWTSWTYAWALVGPMAAGAGILLWGLLHRRMRFVRGGLGALGSGAVLLLVFFAFFEGLLGLGGDRGVAGLGRQLLPVALIALGVVVIAARLMMPARWSRPAGRHGGPGPGEASGPTD